MTQHFTKGQKVIIDTDAFEGDVHGVNRGTIGTYSTTVADPATARYPHYVTVPATSTRGSMLLPLRDDEVKPVSPTEGGQ